MWFPDIRIVLTYSPVQFNIDLNILFELVSLDEKSQVSSFNLLPLHLSWFSQTICRSEKWKHLLEFSSLYLSSFEVKRFFCFFVCVSACFFFFLQLGWAFKEKEWLKKTQSNNLTFLLLIAQREGFPYYQFLSFHQCGKWLNFFVKLKANLLLNFSLFLCFLVSVFFFHAKEPTVCNVTSLDQSKNVDTLAIGWGKEFCNIPHTV